MPVTKGSRLDWIGFSESGVIGSYDSVGVLRCLGDNWGNQWIPIRAFDEKDKEKNENYWVIGFNEQELNCIICKGADKYPLTFPRPVISSVKVKVPLLQSTTSVGQAEEELLRAQLDYYHALKPDEYDNNSLNTNFFKRADKLLLTLIHNACKSDRTMRAMELFTMLSLPKAQEAAIAIATKDRLTALLHRMNLFYQQVQEKQFEDFLSSFTSTSGERDGGELEKEKEREKTKEKEKSESGFQREPLIQTTRLSSSAISPLSLKCSSSITSPSRSKDSIPDSPSTESENDNSLRRSENLLQTDQMKEDHDDNPFEKKAITPTLPPKSNPFAKKNQANKRSLSSSDLNSDLAPIEEKEK